MATGQLTRGEIIDQGLHLGGNPGLVVRARVFLNLFLDRYHRSKDHLELQVDDATLATSIGSEFVSLSSLTLLRKLSKVKLENAATPLEQSLQERFYDELKTNNEVGQKARPTKYAHDRKNDRIVFNVQADQVYSLDVLYYEQPAQISSTADTNAYDADVPDFPASHLMVAAIAMFAQQWNQDTMLALSIRAVDQAMDAEAAEREELDQGANELTLELDPVKYPRFIPD